MEYERISEGVFLRRPNRFIAEIKVGDTVEICHVKNTGRCKELLIPGAKVYVNASSNPKRSTKYDLISVWKNNRLINMDSQCSNRVFEDYLKRGNFIKDVAVVKPEAKYGGSRFDFYFETADRRAFVEVKGVTLEENNVAMFPDAPTERGVKHLKELAQCVAEGYDAYIVFIIQMHKVSHFTPNYKTHPEFGATLTKVRNAGVKAAAFDCVVTPNTMTINARIPIII